MSIWITVSQELGRNFSRLVQQFLKNGEATSQELWHSYGTHVSESSDGINWTTLECGPIHPPVTVCHVLQMQTHELIVVNDLATSWCNMIIHHNDSYWLIMIRLRLSCFTGFRISCIHDRPNCCFLGFLAGWNMEHMNIGIAESWVQTFLFSQLLNSWEFWNSGYLISGSLPAQHSRFLNSWCHVLHGLRIPRFLMVLSSQSPAFLNCWIQVCHIIWFPGFLDFWTSGLLPSWIPRAIVNLNKIHGHRSNLSISDILIPPTHGATGPCKL